MNDNDEINVRTGDEVAEGVQTRIDLSSRLPHESCERESALKPLDLLRPLIATDDQYDLMCETRGYFVGDGIPR